MTLQVNPNQFDASKKHQNTSSCKTDKSILLPSKSIFREYIQATTKTNFRLEEDFDNVREEVTCSLDSRLE